MKIEDMMMTTKIVNSIAVKSIFDQVLKTDPTQEDPVAHKRMPPKGATRFLSRGK